jgi:type I restriction enzyme R subunit
MVAGVVRPHEDERRTATSSTRNLPAIEQALADNELDLALFLNGLPIATGELKNPMTGQHVGHAKHQYRHDRDPKAPIFRFKARALVHFAVDPDEVWMTTRLTGASTRFLPFNRGCEGGAGNPAVEGKHRTCYLWETIWQRDNLLDLVGASSTCKSPRTRTRTPARSRSRRR